MGFGNFVRRVGGAVADVGGVVKNAAIGVANTGAKVVIAKVSEVTGVIAGGTNLFLSDNINQVVPLNKSIDNKAKTYIVIHGYMSGANEDWVKEIQSNLAKKDPSANVLALDWLNGGGTVKSLVTKEYTTAANMAENAGRQLAEYLKANGIDPANVEIIGHSLGAHVAAYASVKSQEIMGKQIGSIVALDPAGVVYGTKLVNSPLGRDCANRVVAIHTNRTLGTTGDVGHLDIHVNPNDTLQPGSSHFLDNHSYAHKMYREMQEGKGYKQPDGSVVDANSLKDRNGAINASTTNGVIESAVSNMVSFNQHSLPDYFKLFLEPDSLIGREASQLGPYVEVAQVTDTFGALSNQAAALLNDPLNDPSVCKLPDFKLFLESDPLIGREASQPGPYVEVAQVTDIFGALSNQLAAILKDPSVCKLPAAPNPFTALGNEFSQVFANGGFGETITMGSLSQPNGSSFNLNALGNAQNFNDIVSAQTGLNVANVEQKAFA
jgi:predicted esterase